MRGSRLEAVRSGRGFQVKDKAAKKQLRHKLRAEERSLGRRLAATVAPNSTGPVLGRTNVVYELGWRTRAVAHGGMGIVAKVVKKLGLAEEIDCLSPPARPAQALTPSRWTSSCGGS
jgi:hypothetical protein